MAANVFRSHVQSLEEELANRNRGLYDCYRLFIASCSTIWNNPLLPWFTDHGPKHSSELVRYFSDLFYSRLFNGSFSIEELFIVMASAYLHDLGMQDLNRENISVTELTDAQYEEIRRLHANRSSDIILNRGITNPFFQKQDYALNCSALPSELYDILALVALGHSTDNYFDAQQQCEQRSYEIPGASIRVDLMIALILFLDELHVHRGRCCLSKFSLFKPNAYSLFHHYLHYYVRNVQLNYPALHILFEFPRAFDPYAERLIEIVNGKIVRQIDMVSTTFSKYGISIDRTLHTKTQYNDRLDFPNQEVLDHFLPIPAKAHPSKPWNALHSNELADLKREMMLLFSNIIPHSPECTKISVVNSPRPSNQIPNDLSLRYLEPNRDRLLDIPEETSVSDFYIWERYSSRLHRIDDGRSFPDNFTPEGFLQSFQDVLKANHIFLSDDEVLQSPEFWIANDVREPHRWATVVHGDVGVGKSTTIRYVIGDLQNSLSQVPFALISIDPFRSFGGSYRISEVSPLDLETSVVTKIRALVLNDFEKLKVSCIQDVIKNVSLRTSLPKIYIEIAEELNSISEDPTRLSIELNSILKKRRTINEDFHYNLGKLIYLKFLAKNGNKTLAKYAHCIFVIDNIDRTSHDTQKAAVKIAKRVSSTLESNVIIALRNRRVHKLYRVFSDEFDQFAWLRMVPMNPPRIGEIFKNRVRSFLAKPSGKDEFYYKKKRINPRQAITEVLDKFLELILLDKRHRKAETGDTGSKAENALLSMYNGNVRRSLATILDLLKSSENALPLDRLISDLRDTLPSHIPPIYERLAFDTFLELFALNGKKIYVRDDSLLENLFCCGLPDCPRGNNLVKLRILKFCARRSNFGRAEVPIEDIFEHFGSILGYSTKLISVGLNQLLDKPRHLLWSKFGSALREGVTSVEVRDPGLFYLNVRNYLWYLCLIKDDSYLPADIVGRIGFGTFSKQKDRRHRDFYFHNWQHTLLFLEYLIYLESLELLDVKRRLGKSGVESFCAEWGRKSVFDETISKLRLYISSGKKGQHVLNSLGIKKNKRYSYLKGRLTVLQNKIGGAHALIFDATEGESGKSGESETLGDGGRA